MANIDMSVIIPSKNNKNKAAEIIRGISKETKGLKTEFIVIDMDSTDNGVLSALNEIKKNNLKGCVIQSGGSTVASALNTGIYKAEGEYITFVYPDGLYKNYLLKYYNTLKEKDSDFIFSLCSEDYKRCIKKEIDGIDGIELILMLIRSFVNIDLGAVMIKRKFLLENNIRFYDDCVCGYSEAFIYNLLMCAPNISFIDDVLKKDVVNSVYNDTDVSNNSCFVKIDAILKVYETIMLCHRDEENLISVFEYLKIPSVIMSAVDILMKENFSCSAIKNSLRQKHYDDFLKISRKTPPKLRSKIIKWKFIPWFYKPN